MLKMTVSEAFLIVVDDLLSLYILASPYSSTGIEQLLQTCIYRLSGWLPGYRSVMRIFLVELLNLGKPKTASGRQLQNSFFGRNFAHDENVFHHSFTLVILKGRNVF